MPIIFIPEDYDYNPLNLEPYNTFNKKFEDKAETLDGALIKLGIANHRKGFVDGFSIDRFYCDDITLKFMFSQIHKGLNEGKDFLIHHTIEYGFDSSFTEFQQEMAEEFIARSAYIYIPGIKQLELSYHLKSKNVMLIFDVVTEKEQIQSVCNQLISHDIAIFSRGW